MFAEVDQDKSGYITFDELENVVRQTLRKSVNVISENTLRGLWCSLDKDDSNSVEKDEMAAFFKLAAPPERARPPPPPKKHDSTALVGLIERHGMGTAIASTPTAEMRVDLEEARVELPNEEQMQKLSEFMNVWLEDYRELKGKAQSATWFNLFAEVDQDGSGFITYDELVDVVRHKLGKGVKVISDYTLMGLWCTLDKDDSNAVEKEEMAGFFKRGASAVVKKKPELKPKEYTSANLLGAGGAIERHGMGGAIASQPTSEMRAELESLGVSFPTDDELTTLSEKMNVWLEEDRELHGRGHSVTWFNLFAEVDQDGSGFITFDELENVIRQQLRKGPKVMSDVLIKALWCTLDKDNSNSVEKDEMAAFFKRGAHAAPKRPPPPPKTHTSANLVGHMERWGMGTAIASQPTAEMRAELEDEGVWLPNDKELEQISKNLNTWLEDCRVLHGRGSSVTWFNLFAEVDQDGSGYITYDELLDVIRHKLHKGPKVMAEKKIKALWCTLDKDDSNSVEKDEMAAFFKLGAPAVKPKSELKHFSTTDSSILGVSGLIERHGMGGAIASTPTSKMLEELKAAGVELPDDKQLTWLSKKLNVWLEEVRVLHGRASAATWFNLFAEVDVDGSGYITYDELIDVIRHKLHKGSKTLKTNEIKALWCALDSNCSNTIDKDEMAAFFKRGAPAVRKSTAKKNVKKEYTAANLLGAGGAIERHGMGNAIASTPTRVMHAELQKAGVALPNAEEQASLSKKFNKWLELHRRDQGKDKSITWFNLFREVDEDGSGYITYDEFTHVIREKLKVKKTQLSDDTVKALWVALDADDSNQIMMDEFSNFLRGKPAPPKKRPPPSPNRSPSRPRKPLPGEIEGPTPEELATIKAKAEANYLAQKEEQRQRALKESAKRLQREREQFLADRLDKKLRMGKQKLDTQYKRDLLSHMYRSTLRSPIPIDNGGRIGGGRILPLYQSERMLLEMEMNGLQKPWPGNRSVNRPRTASASLRTMFTDELSRLDDLITPYWLPKMEMQASRVQTPMASRAQSAASLRPFPSRASTSHGSRPNTSQGRSGASPFHGTPIQSRATTAGSMRPSASEPRLVPGATRA